MKNQNLPFIITALVVISIVFLFTQCRSKKDKTPSGETRVEVLCSGPEYQSDDEFFRANAVGESQNQANSKRKALSNARVELAGQLEVIVKAVIDNYVKDVTVSDQHAFQDRYEGMSREVINQKLKGTKVICEEVTKTEDGIYKTYLAIELMGSEILNAMNERISSDERLRLDYDYEKFKNIFNEEMQKMESERD